MTDTLSADQQPRTRLEAATPHGRSLHQRFHKGSCPSEYGEDCWQLQDILAIEAEAAEQSIPLDVERLARALHESAPETHHRRKCIDRHDLRAAEIAAEYARLLPAQPADHGCLMPSACGVTGFYCSNSRQPPAQGDAALRLLREAHRGDWCQLPGEVWNRIDRLLAVQPTSAEEEHRPAIGLSSAGRHTLCMKCGEPWPCRSVEPQP